MNTFDQIQASAKLKKQNQVASLKTYIGIPLFNCIMSEVI